MSNIFNICRNIYKETEQKYNGRGIYLLFSIKQTDLSVPTQLAWGSLTLSKSSTVAIKEDKKPNPTVWLSWKQDVRVLGQRKFTTN